jgi:N6-adenosine-specific RNA methylase IME4
MLAALPIELRIEIEENVQRKDFTQSELADIQRTVIEHWSKIAKENQGRRSDLTSTQGCVEVAEKPSRYLNVTEKVARLFNESEGQTRKRLAVVEAAEREPEKYGSLRDDMDRSGHVDAPFRRLLVMRQAEAIRKDPPPLPGRGPYRVIVADPPWPYDIDPTGRGSVPYPTLAIPAICALPVATIAHADCILWLWTTNRHMRESYEVLDAWGFERRTILTWAKNKMGLGEWLRGQTEHCHLAIRGKPVVHLVAQTTLLFGDVRAHSQKPEAFYGLVESLCPAPSYLSLYHRGPLRPGWDGHGDEVDVEALTHSPLDPGKAAAR